MARAGRGRRFLTPGAHAVSSGKPHRVYTGVNNMAKMRDDIEFNIKFCELIESHSI